MNHLGKKAQEGQEPADASRTDPAKVSFFSIDVSEAGQRIDNFLLKIAKGVPKSHVYRIIRGGEVRVNKKRVDATYRLESGDLVRMPPLRVAQTAVQRGAAPARPAEFPVLFEDDHMIVINKPSGVAVHGGSGVSFGVIEQLRAARPAAKLLELVHRLDRETSGVLMIAKRRSALTAIHADMRAGNLDKRYLALVAGNWPNARQHVRVPLERYLLADGERRVRVVAEGEGMAAHTVFSLRERFDGYALLEAELKTGRTHQIRVHLAHLGFPIVGDDKYGDYTLNKALGRGPERDDSLKRMFLHAWRLTFNHPATGEPVTVEAPLPPECSRFLDHLRAGGYHAQQV